MIIVNMQHFDSVYSKGISNSSCPQFPLDGGKRLKSAREILWILLSLSIWSSPLLFGRAECARAIAPWMDRVSVNHVRFGVRSRASESSWCRRRWYIKSTTHVRSLANDIFVYILHTGSEWRVAFVSLSVSVRLDGFGCMFSWRRWRRLFSINLNIETKRAREGESSCPLHITPNVVDVEGWTARRRRRR